MKNDRQQINLETMLPTYVFATMSAGKSTLINALLHRELLVTSSLASTAKPYWIYDNDDLANFVAAAYDRHNTLMHTATTVQAEQLKQWNDDQAVKFIELSGNIPFVDDDIRDLVLIDTPGPNNAQNGQHFQETKTLLERDSLPLVIYVINATQVATDDGQYLLKQIVISVAKAGKVSDHILFVLNQMDAVIEESDSILKTTRQYLINNGVKSPRIFPVSAQVAETLRTQLASYKTLDFARGTVERSLAQAANKLLDAEDFMQLQNLASTSDESRLRLTRRLAEYKSAGDERAIAEIYSGVPSLELTIAELVRNKLTAVNKLNK